MRSALATTCSRKRWTLRGQLQGVGFRPFIYRIAHEFTLAGFVRNDSSSVTIEAQGSEEDLLTFVARMRRELPALAKIAEIREEQIEPVDVSEFEIRESERNAQAQAMVTVDTAVCPDCLRELFDRGNFRFGYALINCTNCGPRYSIIRAMPYDRSNTTMSQFGLCEKCHQQYVNPADRRFHAQPVACDGCGPRVGLYRPEHGYDWELPIEKAAELLKAGGIVAVKGLGGFHLACRADNEPAVSELRRRKHRDAKPFAIMAATLSAARELVELSPAAEREITGVAAPIILANRRSPHRETNSIAAGADVKSRVAWSVAMGNHRLGVMLPYTPLHHLLFAALGEPAIPLVMTSANMTDEPLVKDNDEAAKRLAGIADAILLHERDIERSIDDSVLIDMGEQKPLPIRRARGYVPAVTQIGNRRSKIENRTGLCVGGELKNTVAVVRGDEVVLSHHLGDLKHTMAYDYFRKAIDDLCRLFEVRPEWIAHDLHPAYLSTQWAKELGQRWGVPLIAVQHHHAHAAAVLAEHGVTEPALAIVCDGVGYGEDGTAWGGELLLVDGGHMTRLNHLRSIPLAGGDAAARDTRRCAAGVMWEIGRPIDGLFADPTERLVISGMLRTGRNCVQSSAAGRLFDAVAAILGVCTENTHEAQAAMALETLAHDGQLSSSITNQKSKVGIRPDGLDLLPYIAELKKRHEGGESAAELSWEFHEVFAQAWADAATSASESTGVKIVGLSGGVFCNEILTKRICDLLNERGLRVLRHEVVPPNDGGIAFGQAAVARSLLQAGVTCA